MPQRLPGRFKPANGNTNKARLSLHGKPVRATPACCGAVRPAAAFCGGERMPCGSGAAERPEGGLPPKAGKAGAQTKSEGAATFLPGYAGTPSACAGGCRLMKISRSARKPHVGDFAGGPVHEDGVRVRIILCLYLPGGEQVKPPLPLERIGCVGRQRIHIHRGVPQPPARFSRRRALPLGKRRLHPAGRNNRDSNRPSVPSSR